MTLNIESLNGQISSMRGSVKQVKTHLINKLTREAKKLREKKGTEEQKKQNQKKADRFIEEVMLMKKILPDDVSKFVLKTENCESVISKPNIPIETKVMARFGTHKILTTVTDKFRSENPEWKEVIEDLVLKVVSKPKQTIPAQNTPVKCSIVKTPGNNIFSVTPVKHVASGNSQNSQALNNKLGTPVSTKTIKNVETKQHLLSMEKVKGKTPSKVNGAAGVLKPKNVGQSVGEGPTKRKSFMDSSSEEEEETEDSDEFDKETFQKAFKRQKSEDQSEDSEESDEEEESSEDGMAEEGEDSGGDSSEEDSEEESDEEESDSSSETRNNGGQSSNKRQKDNKAGFIKISSSSSVIAPKDTSKDTSAPFAKNKKLKLDEELDEVERRLKKGKTNNRNLNTDDSPEESIDPFFITNDGKEYISTAPAPKNEENKPSPSHFSQNTSAPKEIYRKGKLITPTHNQHRNFNDRNNRGRGRGNYQNRNNDRNSHGNYGDHGDRNDGFHKNDRRSFNKNNGRNFSHNNRGNYSNVNDRRNSFHKNNDGNSDRNSMGNSPNYNDRRNSFNKNNGRGFNRDNRGKAFNYNDRRSAPGGSFNPKDRFDNGKQGPKFDSGRKSLGNTDHLHPSWEAKKKMSTLAPFQGIKTVFND